MFLIVIGLVGILVYVVVLLCVLVLNGVVVDRSGKFVLGVFFNLFVMY